MAAHAAAKQPPSRHLKSVNCAACVKAATVLLVCACVCVCGTWRTPVWTGLTVPTRVRRPHPTALAGAVSRTVTAPIDRLKMLLQTHDDAKGLSLRQGWQKMVAEGGLKHFEWQCTRRGAHACTHCLWPMQRGAVALPFKRSLA